MKILFINQTFYPDLVATAQQLADLCRYLQKEGNEVTVLTGRCGYTEPFPLYKKEEQWHGIRIVRTWPPFLKRLRQRKRVLEALFVNMSFAWKLLFMGRFDRIVALTSPPMISSVAGVIAKWKRSAFIYWVMDINPDEIIEAGWVTRHDVRARVLERALRISLQQSQKIVVLDEYMKARIMERNIPSEKIHTCPPWSHEDELRTIPHDQNSFRKEHHLQDKFVVMYSGNHSICHPLDTLLEAALALRDDPSIVFVFIGSGERKKEVTEFKETHSLSNIIQLPYQDRDTLAFSLSAADLHTVVMGDPFVGVVHPCKIYGILKIGRPFVYIGPEESSINNLISTHAIGKRIGHGDIKRLVEFIQMAQKYTQEQKEMIARASCAALEGDHSKESLMEKISEIITTS